MRGFVSPPRPKHLEDYYKTLVRRGRQVPFPEGEGGRLRRIRTRTSAQATKRESLAFLSGKAFNWTND